VRTVRSRRGDVAVSFAASWHLRIGRYRIARPGGAATKRRLLTGYFEEEAVDSFPFHPEYLKINCMLEYNIFWNTAPRVIMNQYGVKLCCHFV